MTCISIKTSAFLPRPKGSLSMRL